MFPPPLTVKTESSWPHVGECASMCLLCVKLLCVIESASVYESPNSSRGINISC